eukprot:COSAG04_NODE_61_length_30104_cov_10.610932_5_plen_363_part_00
MAAMAFQWSLAALETLMAEDQMDQHATVLRAFSVVELWRLRRVCRAFHRWGTAALAALPRAVAVGGEVRSGETAGVEVLDLSTMRWASGLAPELPEPRDYHGLCSFPDGRLMAAGGWVHLSTAVQWVRGALAWTPLPTLTQGRYSAAAVALPDGRAMVIGGRTRGDYALASVEVLAADGSGWSDLTPTGTARAGPMAAVLPCGKVLVAGGLLAVGSTVKTAELWDPATGAWSDLPSMATERCDAGCCLLPSGRVAVVGGYGVTHQGHHDGEAFDPAAQTWQPLPHMKHARGGHGIVAVAGGLLAVGGANDAEAPDELFDEASGRWFELPHRMVERRLTLSVTSLPTAAVAQPAAAAAGTSYS